MGEDKKKSEDRGNPKSEGLDLPGIVKDIALTGLATVFMTEDAVRKHLKELKIPKELIGSALEGAGKKKDDLYRVVGKELGKMLSQVDIGKELGKFLRGHRIEVSAKFSFEPRESTEQSDPPSASHLKSKDETRGEKK